MATTTNFGWTTPDDTALVKDGASAIRTLGSAIDTSMAQLKGGTTGQVLSKTSNTDMAFTWVAQDDSNAIQNAIVDAKGDLITATASDTPARLAVGTNGQYLVADSTASTGLKWQTLTVSSGANFISRTAFSASSSVTVDNLFSSTYENYLVRIQCYSSLGGTLYMRGRYGTTTHSGANYQYALNGTDTSSTTARRIGNFDQTAWDLGTLGTSTDTTNMNDFNFYRPNSSSRLNFTGTVINRNNSYILNGGGFVESNQTWGGLNIYPASGTITGQITVYGLASA